MRNIIFVRYDQDGISAEIPASPSWNDVVPVLLRAQENNCCN